MNISEIPAGKDAPEDIYVVIEVPKGSSVKYEVDKASGAVFVDRFLFTPMAYPCDYGFIPNTLADDGDPIDVLVVGDAQLTPGVVMRARADWRSDHGRRWWQGRESRRCSAQQADHAL